MFRKQFLLTSENNFSYPWEKIKIGDYSLFYHPELEYECAKNENLELHLLGAIFDWEDPELSNLKILNRVLEATNFEAFIESQSRYAGQFVIIYKSEAHFVLLNDACAQSEVYYNTGFTSFASQPKLLSEVIALEPDQGEDAREFFTSAVFQQKRLFTGQATHVKNVKHLLPNHLLDLNKKEVVRFFPTVPLVPISISEAAEKGCKMITGYVRAISLRNKIVMAVTGGYDSRVLFLASLGVECQYFVLKHSNMDDSHYDIAIPKKLTKLYSKDFYVIPDLKENGSAHNSDYEKSIDFPRYFPQASKYLEYHVYLNGNVSEIARNYFGYHKHLSPQDLAALNGYPNAAFVAKEYKAWLESNLDLFQRLGYHFLDMFYWEEKMGNWAAKSKSEANALGRTVLSPFNSRELLQTLLSTQRKYRDSHFNKLYDKIIYNFSPQALAVPINPSRKQHIIRLMKLLRIYNLYRHFGLKYGWLKM